MSNKAKITVSVPFPFFSILTLLFIGLKLTNYIAWSWWWVLSPLWLPFATVLGVMGIVLLVALVASFFSNGAGKPRRK